jgi:hypothetical protein
VAAGGAIVLHHAQDRGIVFDDEDTRHIRYILHRVMIYCLRNGIRS